MDSDGSNQVNISNAGGNDVNPQWSPDGAKSVYAEAPSGINQDIYIMNADGSNPIRLTTHSSQDYNPDWGP